MFYFINYNTTIILKFEKYEKLVVYNFLKSLSNKNFKMSLRKQKLLKELKETKTLK